MYIRSLMFSALALTSSAVLAAPQLEAVTNEVDAEAGELRISIQGHGFGAGPEVLFFHDFRGVKDGTPVDETEPRRGSLSVGFSNPVVASYKSEKGFLVVDESTGRNNLVRVDLDGVYENVFVAYSVVVPEGRTAPAQTTVRSWGGSTWKFAWLLEEDGANSNDSQFDMVVPTQVGDLAYMGGNASKFRSAETGGAKAVIEMSEFWEWDGFNHMSSWVGSGGFNGIADPSGNFSVFNEDFGYITRRVDDEFELRGPEPKVSRVNFPGWVRKTSDDNFQAIYSNLYVSGGESMLARIEVTDNRNYDSSVYRKVLFPESWSDGRIETTLGLESLKNGGSLYLHIFDSDGRRSEHGVRACQKCPVMTSN